MGPALFLQLIEAPQVIRHTFTLFVESSFIFPRRPLSLKGVGLLLHTGISEGNGRAGTKAECSCHPFLKIPLESPALQSSHSPQCYKLLGHVPLLGRSLWVTCLPSQSIPFKDRLLGTVDRAGSWHRKADSGFLLFNIFY